MNELRSARGSLDRLGVALSGLCALHCILSILIVSALGLASPLLLDPAIHRVGLALALLIGTVGLGLGVRRHRQTAPLQIGAAGLSLMALALLAGHGPHEAVLTIAGVVLVAGAHLLNLRGAR